MSLLNIYDASPSKCVVITDMTREKSRSIGPTSDLFSQPRYWVPGGFKVIFHEDEADNVYNWVLDVIETDKRPPIGLFEPEERVKGLPAYLWTRKALKEKSDFEYKRNTRPRGLL